MKQCIAFASIALLVNAQIEKSQVVLDGDLYNKDSPTMKYASHWKKEVVFWAAECIYDIQLKLSSTDRIHYAGQGDLRFQLGVLMGRILELYRQQLDMYRRIKRRVENEFNWIRYELAQQVTYRNGSQTIDYKPFVYVTALEYITKRQQDIEHIVKLVMDYIGEEEVVRYESHLLPSSERPADTWKSYSTIRNAELASRSVLRQGAELPDSMEQKEKALKQEMHKQYYNKRKNEKNKR